MKAVQEVSHLGGKVIVKLLLLLGRIFNSHYNFEMTYKRVDQLAASVRVIPRPGGELLTAQSAAGEQR